MQLGTSKKRSKEFDKVSKKQFYKKLITRNPTIIDVGANRGQSIDFFKKIFPKSKIYAFEPTRLFEFLIKKYKKNKNIKISSFAVHSKKARKKIYYHTFKTRNVLGLSGFYKINKQSKDHIRLNTLKRKDILKNINHSFVVNCISLDEFLIRKKIKKIDLLKIDTQGNELNVLKGSKKILKNIKFIKLELMLYDYYEKSYSISEIDSFLMKYNFKIFNIIEVNQNPVNYKTDWIEVLYYNTKFKL